MPRTPSRSLTLRQQIDILEAERQQTQRALDALYRIGLVCRGVHDARVLLQTICDELQTIWAFDACYVALCDSNDPDRYRLALLIDGDAKEFIEFDEIGTLTRYVLDRRQPLLVNDLLVERTQLGLPPATFFGTEQPSRAWMGVPLLIGQDALGVVSLQSYTVSAFSASDLDLLARMGAAMAVALENATLAHRQTQLSRSLAEQVALRNADLFVISDIAAMLTQQQALPTVFDTVLDFLLDSLGLSLGAISRYADDQHMLIAQRGLTKGNLPTLINGQPTLIGRAIAEKRTVSFDQDQRIDDISTPALAALQRVLVVPLLRNDVVIGTLLVGSSTPRHLREEEIELLQVVANQLALALEHGTILQQRDRQIAELEAMGRISYAAGRSLSTSTLLRDIHDALFPLMSIDVFYMAIYDVDRGVLTDSVAIESGHEERYQMSERPPMDGTFTKWVLDHCKTLFLREVSAELTNYPELRRRTVSGLPSETWLGVPLLDGLERPLGVISVQSYRAHAFSDRDEQFLQAVAGQVSLHVRNVQLFHQRERQLAELNALQRISELINSTLDLEAMIHSIDEVLTSFLSVDAFFVALYNTEQQILDGLYVLESGEVQYFDHLVGQPLPPRTPTLWVINHGQPLRFNNVAEELTNHPEIQPFTMTEPGAASWLGVPLITREGQVLGALTVQSYQVNHFSERDELFMLQLARQLTLTVQNARLFAERERQLAELDALQRITELVTSTLELEPMLRSIDQILSAFLRADASQVMVHDNERNIIELAIIREQGQEVQTKVVGRKLPEGSFIAWTFVNARPLRLGNVYTEWSNYVGLTAPHTPDGRPKPSWLSVPLLEAQGHALGVLALRAYREQAFTARDEQFLLNVGRQLGLSVRNARLYAGEQMAHRTAETLREIARVLNTSFNPDEVLALILRELKQVIAYDSASVMLPMNKVLRIVARQSEHSNDADQQWRELHFPISATNGAGRVMLTTQPLVINDTLDEPNWTKSPMQNVVRSWIGVPLISKGTVLGVLNINSLNANAFRPRDVEIAMTFANQAATALEHARLYQESVTRVEQELEIAHQIQSNLFPRNLPQISGFRISGVCIPARETGGDFYDVQQLNAEQWAFMVGDASGKSIPAAMLMAVARSVVRSEARDHNHPEVVMAETNRWICLDVPQRSFVALAYATLHTRTRLLSLTNAGQLEPICLRADGSLEYLHVSGPRLPLGIDPKTGYQAATFRLSAGDRVVFYTDGVVEAQNEVGELWGFERLEETLQAVGRTLEPAMLIEHILATINVFIGTRLQHDDITLLVLETEGSA